MKHLALFIPLLALAAAHAEDPATNRLPDAGIRLAGTNAVVSALEALRGMTGHIAQTRDIPYPDRFARLLKEKAGLTLADRPFFFLVWLPEEMTGAATPEAALAFLKTDAVPGELLILPVEEDGSDDFPALAAGAENDAAFHRGRWFYLAGGPDAKAFAEWCGADPFPVLAACQAFYDADPPARGVARAFLREPARFKPFRDGLLAKRKAFHANLARLRERAAVGEDVADELRRAEHMEVHAKAEEAIGDLLFSLLDASKFAYVDLDCDATRGLRVIRVLEGIPPSEPLDERIRLRRFLEDNIPFLAFPDPEEAAWQEARRVWHNRFVDAADQLTDIWVLPPDAVGTIANYARRFLTEPATPAAAKPSAQPDADGDGLPDSVERERFNTDPDNPDTDADDLRDGDEATKYHTDPCNPDTDADGLRDGDEMYEHRTDPLNPDTDGDGLTDGAEVLKHKTNPLNPDTDGDGVKDGAEINAGTDPLRHAEGAEKKPHAESAETESPLAAALARGDWIPVVVESVTIDTTVPRQLRKNWVVSFSGGVKARVHSPVKTFCASVGELPGKRFTVRFVDRAAATNALHGTVYAGELEVQPAQSPEDPATNAPQSSRKEAVATGFDVAAACRLLSQSRTATIHLISETTGKPIALPEDIQTKILAALGSARNGSFPTNAPLLGCRFRFAANDSFAAVESWFKAMGFIDFLSKDGAGNRIKANEQEELLFHAFRPLPDGDEAYVHVFGSSLSPGAPVAVVPGLGPLLESAATASQRPVEPEPPSPPSGPIAEKMKRIVLPIVDFRQSSVVDVVAELEDLARNHDDFVAAARGQGVTFVLDVPADAVDSLPLVTCKMKSVSVYSALDMIAEMSGLEWRVDGDVVRLTLAQRRPAANETHAEAEDGVDGGCFGHAPSAEN